jgi:hypothetical protein
MDGLPGLVMRSGMMPAMRGRARRDQDRERQIDHRDGAGRKRQYTTESAGSNV